jgi:hypothetical protein
MRQSPDVHLEPLPLMGPASLNARLKSMHQPLGTACTRRRIQAFPLPVAQIQISEASIYLSSPVFKRLSAPTSPPVPLRYS